MTGDYVDRYEDPAADPPYTPTMRLRGIVETDRLDIAAFIWMLCVLATIGVAVYLTFRTDTRAIVSGPSAGWQRAYTVSRSVDMGVAVALAVGLAVAAAYDSALSRAAASLGIVGGGWMLVCGGLRIAYHAKGQNDSAPRPFWGADVTLGFTLAIFGLLIAMAAWRISTTVLGVDFDDEDEDLDTDTAAL